MTRELSAEEFEKTFGRSMMDVTETAEPVTDIWAYVENLKNDRVVQEAVYEREVVEKVYRNVENTYDQVLLPTENKNVFIVIVVDLLTENIFGHFKLDLEQEYGLK